MQASSSATALARTLPTATRCIAPRSPPPCGRTAQVSLNGSAFNADGVAARVAAAGSNRAKLRGGVACFKGVRLAAPMEGLFKLTVSCVSRKLVVQEAVLMVKVRGRAGVACTTARSRTRLLGVST